MVDFEDPQETPTADSAANFLRNLNAGEYTSNEDLVNREIASFCKTAEEIRKLAIDKNLIQGEPVDVLKYGFYIDTNSSDADIFQVMLIIDSDRWISTDTITLKIESNIIKVINLSFAKEADTGEPYYKLSFLGLKDTSDNDSPPLFYQYDFGLNHQLKKTVEQHSWDNKGLDQAEIQNSSNLTPHEAELIGAGLHIVKSRIESYNPEKEE